MEQRTIKLGCPDRQTAEEVMFQVTKTGFFAAEPEPIFTKRAMKRKSGKMASVNVIIDKLNGVEEPETSIAYAHLEKELDKIIRENDGKVKVL